MNTVRSKLGSVESREKTRKPALGAFVSALFKAAASVLIVSVAVISSASSAFAAPSGTYTLLRFTEEQRAAQNKVLLSAPDAIITAQKDSQSAVQGGSLSLLSRISYVPVERDQGNSGTCWVWAGTGVMEIALNVQRGISDRLSIQYLDSSYTGDRGWAGEGGTAYDFSSFYNSSKIIIPWSNLNAYYQDFNSTSRPAMPAASIAMIPNYALNSVTSAKVPIYGMSTAAAISNIKNVLDQNRGIYFGFELANDSDWNQFKNWWHTQPETAIWSYGFSDGKYYNPRTGGGHAVVCVGYNDSDPDPAKHYWIMLNSWGTTSNRPNGLFRIPMEYNYSSADSVGDYNTEWWTIIPIYSAPVPLVSKMPSAPTAPSVLVNPKNKVPALW